MNLALRQEQDEIQKLQRDYDNLLVDLDQSNNQLGGIGEDIGNSVDDDRLNNDILYEFEKYIDANGFRIGRWKIMMGNGEHFFIKDTKR